MIGSFIVYKYGMQTKAGAAVSVRLRVNYCLSECVISYSRITYRQYNRILVAVLIGSHSLPSPPSACELRGKRNTTICLTKPRNVDTRTVLYCLYTRKPVAPAGVGISLRIALSIEPTVCNICAARHSSAAVEFIAARVTKQI